MQNVRTMQCYTSTTVVEREAEGGRGRHRRDDSATSWISRMQLVFGADNVTLFVPCRRAMCRSYQQFSCTSPTCRYQHTGRRRQRCTVWENFWRDGLATLPYGQNSPRHSLCSLLPPSPCNLHCATCHRTYRARTQLEVLRLQA